MSEPDDLYRAQGMPVERRFVMCPTCQRPVEVEREESSVCAQCETRFATTGATTLVEYNTTRQLAHMLESETPATREMSSSQRWVLTGGALAGIGALTAAFGAAGFMVSAGLALGLFAVAMARAGGGMIR